MDLGRGSRAADGPLPDGRTIRASCGSSPDSIGNGCAAAGIGNGGVRDGYTVTYQYSLFADD